MVMDLSTRKWQHVTGQYDGLLLKYKSIQDELHVLYALKNEEMAEVC